MTGGGQRRKFKNERGSREFHGGGDQGEAKRTSHKGSIEEVSQNRGPKRWQDVCPAHRARRNSKHYKQGHSSLKHLRFLTECRLL